MSTVSALTRVLAATAPLAPDGAVLVLAEGAKQDEADSGQLWRLSPAQ